MKLLLDTNVLIPLDPSSMRDVEAGSAAAARLHQLALQERHSLFVHPNAVADFGRDTDPERRQFRELQLAKYPKLENPPSISAALEAIVGAATVGTNDWVDNSLLAALLADAVDVIVTDDQRIHRKARRLSVADRVLLLGQAVRLLAADVDEVNQAPPAVESVKAYLLDPADQIFESFRLDYGEAFDTWLQKCRREHRQSWIIRALSTDRLDAIAIVNPEDSPPPQASGRTLKLCTFKVADHAHGLRYGELLLGAVLEYALHNEYDCIYLTAFERQEALIDLLEDFGFERTPDLTSLGEAQFIKRVNPVEGSDQYTALEFNIKFGPSHVRVTGVPWYVVPIRPQWADTLFPSTAAQQNLLSGQFAHGNALRKAYQCNSAVAAPPSGSVLAFYRSEREQGIIAIGVVESCLRAQDADAIATFVSSRTVYSYLQIRELASRSILAIKFRLARIVLPQIALEDLLAASVLKGPPQSVQQIHNLGQLWLTNRIQL